MCSLHFQGGCTAGLLTVLGQDQAVALGHKFRQKYIDNLGLIDAKYDSSLIK